MPKIKDNPPILVDFITSGKNIQTNRKSTVDNFSNLGVKVDIEQYEVSTTSSNSKLTNPYHETKKKILSGFTTFQHL